VIGQIGDLVASKFKRQAQIKDFSNIFPGHGGILDRFDSSMFAALHLVMIMIIIGLI
jgi:phosphatidate cytidylyltransferase